MKRRGFLGLLGMGIPAAVVAAKTPFVKSDVTSEIAKMPISDVTSENLRPYDSEAFIPETWAKESLEVLEENMVVKDIVHRDFDGFIGNISGQGELIIIDTDEVERKYTFDYGEIKTSREHILEYRSSRGVLDPVYMGDYPPEVNFELHKIQSGNESLNINQAIKRAETLVFKVADQTMLLDNFMYQSMEWSLKDNWISVNGKFECHLMESV